MDPSQVIETWFELYRHDVFNFLVYHTGRIDVEDLVQETFIRAFKHLNRFSYKSSPKTWLLAIARNLAIDDARKRNKQPVDRHKEIDDIAGNEALHRHSSSQPTPDEVVNFNETQSELMTEILSLSPNYRDVIILRAIMEYSIKETAKILQWSESRVRVTFFRGLKQLRRNLVSTEKEGELHGFI